MKNLLSYILMCTLIFTSCKNEEKTRQPKQVTTKTVEPETEVINKKIAELKITPIQHATMVLEYDKHIVYIDPVGGKKAFNNSKSPTIILITDIHGDHLNIETLQELTTNDLQILAPKAVYNKLTEDLKAKTTVISNGETKTINSLNIEAVAMYNLRPEALKFHEKGRGNGYIITFGEERIYISGDTEDITEMRMLKNIDKAFICMNLPYTMPVESAASAVIDFEPKEVYPYHYRGTNGLSDVSKFKMLVNAASDTTKVIQLDWYPNTDNIK